MNHEDAQVERALRPVTTLDEYLDLASRRRWRWGQMDCVQFGLGWAIERAARDLAAPLAYHDADTARAFLAMNGGLLNVVSQWMDAHGFEPTAEPDDGDIGVASVSGDDPMNIAGACVAIRRGPWWIGKAVRGLCSVGGESIPTWRIA